MKKSNIYSRYNQTLLDRIDNMKSERDFDPYQAERKYTVDREELFTDKNYMTEDELEDALEKEAEQKEEQIEDRYSTDAEYETEDAKGSAGAVIAVILIILLCGIGAFVYFKFIK